MTDTKWKAVDIAAGKVYDVHVKSETPKTYVFEVLGYYGKLGSLLVTKRKTTGAPYTCTEVHLIIYRERQL